MFGSVTPGNELSFMTKVLLHPMFQTVIMSAGIISCSSKNVEYRITSVLYFLPNIFSQNIVFHKTQNPAV